MIIVGRRTNDSGVDLNLLAVGLGVRSRTRVQPTEGGSLRKTREEIKRPRRRAYCQEFSILNIHPSFMQDSVSFMQDGIYKNGGYTTIT